MARVAVPPADLARLAAGAIALVHGLGALGGTLQLGDTSLRAEIPCE